MLFSMSVAYQGHTQDRKCFDFIQTETPERMAIHQSVQPRNNTWCYQKIDSNRSLIFNFNEQKIKVETSIIVEQDEDRIISIEHGSLFRGERIIARQDHFYFNPFNIPLYVKTAENKAIRENLDIAQFQPLTNHLVDHVLNDFDRLPKIQADQHQIGIETTANEEIFLPDEQLPQNGYWWPHRGVPLARPENSPLHLYDQYVEKVHGTNPNSREWELRYHSLEHVSWGGHCNGWAASAVLDQFEEDYFYDEANLNMISPADIQGMRSETAFCVNWAFYGKRYRNQEDDSKDIYPDRFHKVLRYYIKYLNKPVALDRYSHSSVDNSVISGYRFEVEPINERRVKVTAHTRMHFYSGSYVYQKQAAANSTRIYKYYLDLDENGEISGGEWISGNPDFLWVPLAQEKCGRENPRMHHGWVDQMIQRLAKYEKHSKQIDQSTGPYELSPNQSSLVEISTIEGQSLRFEGRTQFIDNTHLQFIDLVVIGTDHRGAVLQKRYPYSGKYQQVFKHFGSINKIGLYNRSDQTTIPIENFIIDRMIYFTKK
jgi:hypothetical protein